MITTIIISVETLIVAILATYVLILSRKCRDTKRILAMMKLMTFDILCDISKCIDKFNEKYDVQLSLDLTEEDEKGDRHIELKFTDPKDEEQPEEANTTE